MTGELDMCFCFILFPTQLIMFVLSYFPSLLDEARRLEGRRADGARCACDAKSNMDSAGGVANKSLGRAQLKKKRNFLCFE